MKTSQTTDEALNAELEALNTIARALASVPDRSARARILGWVNDRFADDGSEPLPAEPRLPRVPAVAAVAVAAADPTLTVGSLDDMFESAPPAEAPKPPAGKQPVETLIKGFVTDFNQLVVEWQGA